MNNGKDAVDWALIVSVIGLLLGLLAQQVQIYERVTRIETSSASESTLCDCFNTRSRVGVLEQRVNNLEQR
jgi:hypothetical protein